MLELNDRNLLALMDQNRGAGLEIDGVKYVRAGETPLAFITRVREEHSAWRYRQEIEKAVAAKGARESNRARSDGPKPDREGVQEVVQSSEASLEEILKSKILSLDKRLFRNLAEGNRLSAELDKCKREGAQLHKDRELAAKFLEELNASTPENNKKMGADLVGEVREEQGGSDSVGQSDST